MTVFKKIASTRPPVQMRPNVFFQTDVHGFKDYVPRYIINHMQLQFIPVKNVTYPAKSIIQKLFR